MSRDAKEHPVPYVAVRSLRSADLPELYRQQADQEGARMAAVVPRDAASFDSHWEKIMQDPSVVALAIECDGELVGQISCFKMDGVDSVGYSIAREHWGRGIATRALALLLGQVATRPLHARVARHNVASIRVLQRCGFVLTGYEHAPATERYLECEEAVLVLKNPCD